MSPLSSMRPDCMSAHACSLPAVYWGSGWILKQHSSEVTGQQQAQLRYCCMPCLPPEAQRLIARLGTKPHKNIACSKGARCVVRMDARIHTCIHACDTQHNQWDRYQCNVTLMLPCSIANPTIPTTTTTQVLLRRVEEEGPVRHKAKCSNSHPLLVLVHSTPVASAMTTLGSLKWMPSCLSIRMYTVPILPARNCHQTKHSS
jgi:hypothetical protein